MKRLRKYGASLSSPALDEAKLLDALEKLGIAVKFNKRAVRDIYFKIAVIIGSWHAKLEAKEASPVATMLLSTARSLTEVSRLLSGHQTGERSAVELNVTNEVIRLLERDMTVDAAHVFIDGFRDHAGKIARACETAHQELTGKGEHGRPANDWYDDFTKLLLDIAARGGVKTPSIGEDRVTGKRTGWLFKAAQALEPFLERRMRSQSKEACGKRLERSRKRLRSVKRQKPARA